MKNLLTILAILVLLAACAPQAPQVTPAAQPAPVVEQSPATAPAEALPEPAPAETAPPAPESTSRPATHEVEIKGFKFDPAVITIAAGDTVRWTNKDSAPHDATAKDRSWATRTPLRKGESDIVTFNTPGTYDYICSIHPNMKATVVVR